MSAFLVTGLSSELMSYEVVECTMYNYCLRMWQSLDLNYLIMNVVFYGEWPELGAIWYSDLQLSLAAREISF
jgi:hypothetical protein